MPPVDGVHQIGQMEAVERTRFCGCVKGADNPQLLGRQGRLLGEGDIGQHLGKLQRLTGGPFPFFRPLERGNRGG